MRLTSVTLIGINYKYPRFSTWIWQYFPRGDWSGYSSKGHRPWGGYIPQSPRGKVCIFTEQNLGYLVYSITSEYTGGYTLLKYNFAVQKVAVHVDTHFWSTNTLHLSEYTKFYTSSSQWKISFAMGYRIHGVLSAADTVVTHKALKYRRVCRILSMDGCDRVKPVN